MQVATVQGGHVVMQAVTLGRDFGTTVEVVSGLTGNEQVVIESSRCAARRPGGARGRAG